MTTVAPAPPQRGTARGPALAAGLRAHGDRLAVAGAGERLTYDDLADRVDRLADELGPVRRLVLVEAATDVASLVGYLAGLRGGHVVLLADGADRTRVTDLVADWDPDVVIAGGRVRHRRPGTRHDLHPDLALLLTTSGSTGRPRLVRLSADAVDANADAIAATLGITAADRPVLSLPMHYCYGLSVVNSALVRGAGLLLDDRSVTDPGLWAAVRAHGATGLHGVPHTFALLERVGFADMDLPYLRYVTQAGGRLAPDRVRHWAAVGRRRGWDLVVMYGQTEATARMAVLPPALADAHPGAAGRAVPGGSFRVEPVEGIGGADEAVGELVYEGPNVMLGYAEHPADLALGRTVHALRTGDLGRVTGDGLVEVVGRRSRFVKPFGIRIDLDGLERLLAERGVAAACAGDDARIVVAAVGRPVPTATVRAVTGRLGLPADAVAVVVVTEIPRRGNGKVDHAAVARLAPSPTTTTPTVAGRGPWWRRTRPDRSVREVFAHTFPGVQLRDDASFVDLGGDSLTYVQVSADVERALGHLPDGWDRVPLGELAATAPRRTRWATLETAVVLRALAVVFVVGEHAHLWAIYGGAHLMLAVAGWAFARFLLAARGPAAGSGPDAGDLPRRILSSAARIAVPAALWIALRAAEGNVRWVDTLLVGSLDPPIVRGYWFVDDLVQILVVLAVLFAVPAVRRLERRDPFGLAVVVLAVALLGRLVPTGYADWFTVDLFSTQVVLWIFVLGWLAQRATSPAQKMVVAVAVLVLVPPFFVTGVEEATFVTVGLLLLLLVPRVRVPRVLAGPLVAVAAASLAIYLTHFALLPLAGLGVPAVVIVPLAVVVGVATWSAIHAGRRLASARTATRLPA